MRFFSKRLPDGNRFLSEVFNLAHPANIKHSIAFFPTYCLAKTEREEIKPEL